MKTEGDLRRKERTARLQLGIQWGDPATLTPGCVSWAAQRRLNIVKGAMTI
jgi:hypothetical protein